MGEKAIVDLIYFIIAAAVAAIFIFVMVSSYFRLVKTGTEPMYTVDASVSGKRSASGGDEMMDSGNSKQAHGKAGTGNEYFAVFANSDGAQKELRVTKSEYEALTVGARGTLVFRGDVMVSFEEKASEQDEVEENEE